MLPSSTRSPLAPGVGTRPGEESVASEDGCLKIARNPTSASPTARIAPLSMTLLLLRLSALVLCPTATRKLYTERLAGV